MPREVPADPHTWKKPPPAERHSYDIELITPIFGGVGGASTRVTDPSFPVRPTSIRGHLQFWWRAMVGAQYDSRSKLREEQSKVWGNTAQASRVHERGVTETGRCGLLSTRRKYGAR